MDGDNKVWTIFWMLLAIVISVIVVSTASVVITNSNNITRLVLNGTNPVDAYCAIKSETQTARCLVSAIGAKRD